MGRRHHIDNTERRCAVCQKTFKIPDYPPGYFAYKYQAHKGSACNTCSPCEIDHLERLIRDHTTSDGYRLELQQDIHLLRTGEIVTERHKRQLKRVYGVDKPCNL